MVFLSFGMVPPGGSSILLKARGWLVGRVSLGLNGPIRITVFDLRVRDVGASLILSFLKIEFPDAVRYGFGYHPVFRY